MLDRIMCSPLFASTEKYEIETILEGYGSFVKEYKKDEFVFQIDDTPNFLFILLDGEVEITRLSFSGEKEVISHIKQVGDLFGEVYLFLEKDKYDMYCVATKNTKLLCIPRAIFSHLEVNQVIRTLEYNLIKIFAKKAYQINSHIKVLQKKTLRSKITQFIYDRSNGENSFTLSIGREAMADYLNVRRPSLSRELSLLQDEGILVLKREAIIIKNLSSLIKNL